MTPEAASDGGAELDMRGITKRFGDVVANRQVDFVVRRGEVHALVGENGAGKSTLMRIAAGIMRPDEGGIRVSGETRSFASARDAAAAGIGMVHQHFSLVPSLTIAENIFLAEPPNQFGVLDPKLLRRRAAELSTRYRLDLPTDGKVGNQPVGVQQRVEILKALLTGRKILILDEPTAVLTPQEADHLFATLRALRASGHTIILITHKLREVFAVADRITVMRDGRAFPPVAAAESNPSELARMMVGRDVLLRRPNATQATPGPEALRLDAVSCRNDRGATALDAVSLTLHAGEILGIAGVNGNGQDELVEVVAGLRQPSQGRIVVVGRDVTTARSPRARRAAGIAHIPTDRMRRGVALPATVAENLMLGPHERPPLSRGPWLQSNAVRAFADTLIDRFGIRTPSAAAPVAALSGGNVQKVVVARELTGEVTVLLAANPTRGVDIGAAEFIHRQLEEARARGAGVLLVSSELDEVRALSDRILVMAGGRFAGPFAPDVSEHELGVYMGGGDRAMLGSEAGAQHDGAA